jgi:hypothetical protein
MDQIERWCTGKDDDGCAGDPELGRCVACGYVFHDVPRDTDEAHGELCCGTQPCSVAEDDLCVTHFLEDVAVVVIDVTPVRIHVHEGTTHYEVN